MPTRHSVAALGGERRAIVGLGAVADDVAEAPELVDARLLDRVEDGLERGQVAWMSLRIATRMRPGGRQGAARTAVYRRDRCPATSRGRRRDAPVGAVGATARGRRGRGRGRRLAAAARATVVEPVAVDEGDYFEPAQVERAEDYRDGQRLLLSAGVAVQGAVLVAAASRAGPRSPARAARARRRAAGARRRRRCRGPLGRARGRRPAVRRVAHERAVDVGLSTQDLGAWLGDWAKANGDRAVLAAGVGDGRCWR